MNLGKAIDRLLKIDPQLGEKLIPIRDKFLLRPRRSKIYWKELMDVMNSDPIRKHPQWSEFRQIFIPKRKQAPQKNLYTFEEIDQNDICIGVIPENIADRLRRHDRRNISMAKITTEAELTGDKPTLIRLFRERELLGVELKKLWIILKDHFELWDKDIDSVTIRKHGPVLVLTKNTPPTPQQQQNSPRGQVLFQTPFGTVQTSPEVLKQIMKLLGLPPFPGSENE